MQLFIHLLIAGLVLCAARLCANLLAEAVRLRKRRDVPVRPSGPDVRIPQQRTAGTEQIAGQVAAPVAGPRKPVARRR